MNKIFSDESWADYLWWLKQDKKTLKRINTLIKSIEREGVAQGIGKPEALRGDLTGFWSRRIDEKHRLVYEIFDTEVHVDVVSAYGHYGDK